MKMKETLDKIANHELLLLKRELIRLGVFDRYVHNRSTCGHLIYFTSNQGLDLKNIEDEPKCSVLDGLKKNYVAFCQLYTRGLWEDVGILSPGYFLNNFVGCGISFNWSDTPEGSNFWSNVCTQLRESRINNYLIGHKIKYFVTSK